MKTKFYFLFIIAAAVCSCSPYLTTIPIEMQAPSYTNNFLWNKSITISFDESETEAADEFQNKFTLGFAKGLEKTCYSDRHKIDIFKLPRTDSSAIYNTKLGMLKLVMEFETDVVIHIPQAVVSSGQLIQYIYLYDTKSAKDKVSLVKKIGDIPAGVTSEELVGFAESFGLETALAYQPNWVNEEFPIYASPMMGDGMDIAFTAASSFNWKQAISHWMPYTVDGNDPKLKSMAAFNLAVGCFFEGQYDLAKQWLEYSDKSYKLPESDNLHKKFALYMQ